MEKSLFRFIWKFSARQQIFILLITIISYPITYILLELPKLIVNDAIQGDELPARYSIGVEFDQVSYLILLCFGLPRALWSPSNGHQADSSTSTRGGSASACCGRLRFELFQRVLALPSAAFPRR